jgi:hypothetical protein
MPVLHLVHFNLLLGAQPGQMKACPSGLHMI